MNGDVVAQLGSAGERLSESVAEVSPGARRGPIRLADLAALYRSGRRHRPGEGRLLEGRADVIVTGDADLLALEEHERPRVRDGPRNAFRELGTNARGVTTAIPFAL